METVQALRQKLLSIDGKGYGAYKGVQGGYNSGWFQIFIDHVQADPFAPPSRLRARVEHRFSGFPRELFVDRAGRVALQDFVARELYRQLKSQQPAERAGTGKSGVLSIDRCGQEILERTAILVTADFIEARFSLGLPARGRTVQGKEAAGLITGTIPGSLEKCLLYKNISKDDLKAHVDLVRDQEFLRGSLEERGLVAFVANGSILPRESGISDRPLKGKTVVPFLSPPDLEIEFTLPVRGRIAGMGVPRGVTLIVGGGYHGKSTLLRAIERGIYNHIAGDGREMVITDGSAVKIRSEDGRRVESVDIGPFINNLPFGQDTSSFCTENASGSTSQAANIMEAIECGTSLLLLDEDTSATNFMIRDGRMQRLVAKEYEPITPFIDRVRDLYSDLKISSILVVGGSGDYLKVADLVIKMQEYRASDATSEARAIIDSTPDFRVVESTGAMGRPSPRVPIPVRGGREDRVRIKARGLEQISFGGDEINLAYVDQLVDPSQTRALAQIIRYAYDCYVDGRRSLPEIVERVLQDIREGLDVVSPYARGSHPGDYALPRGQEIAAAFNRLRSLRVCAPGKK
ncbi:MAG: ABC transporter ATPase [Peptococcaceae bacterium BICA1-7]|nr:MAG: ABC transporter ATPase [Peptococcaceae bacterium BICA1-7]HBV99524.1 ATPase [Desulfotomaculum sp.]